MTLFSLHWIELTGRKMCTHIHKHLPTSTHTHPYTLICVTYVCIYTYICTYLNTYMHLQNFKCHFFTKSLAKTYKILSQFPIAVVEKEFPKSQGQ